MDGFDLIPFRYEGVVGKPVMVVMMFLRFVNQTFVVTNNFQVRDQQGHVFCKKVEEKNTHIHACSLNLVRV